MSIFTISPIQSSQRTVSHTPYPPPILAKHHTWYSADTDLFISICRILLDSTVPIFANLITSRLLWTLQNLNDPCPMDLKPFTPCPLMISTNFPLHISSHFSINLAILSAPNGTGKIYMTIALTGIYQNTWQ